MLTDTARGNYSAKFQILEEELDKDVGVEHALQVAARDRARKLSLETNRRRKALETKKKLEAQRESKRRQEVLEERRQKQREATNRYQRLNKGTNKRHGEHNNTAPAYPGAPLQDGIRMARGYRLDSARSHGSGTPSLDDMLQMVGVPSSLSLKYGQGYATYQHNGMASPSTYPGPSHYNGSYTDTNANITAGSETNGYAKPTYGALNSAGNQGRVDSRASLLEQEIAAQQQQLFAQQQRTLQEFSQAIQNETSGENHGGHLQRSGSLSSLDSLEEQKDKQTVHKTVGYDGHSAYGQGVVPNGIQGPDLRDQMGSHSHVPADVTNYSLYHNDVLMRGSYEKMTDEEHRARSIATQETVSNHSPASGMQGSGYSHTTGHRTTKGDGGKDHSASSQAWSNSKASKPPIPHHVSAQTASTSQRSRPYSAHTTATAVTVAPAVSYGARTHNSQAQQRVGATEPSFLATSNAPQGLTKQEMERPSEEDLTQPVSPPKSILKTHKTDTPTKEKKTRGLAAAIMKDSLEIGKISGLKSPKKSVRWTDIAYSDDESVVTQTTATTESTAHVSRKPRLISSVNARTVQERLGAGTETAVTATPPRPRSGQVTATKDRNSVQLKNNRYPNGSEAKHVPSEKERVANQPAPVMQNGIRLDKTPTDDEINWLWDKVRTCLHTREEGAESRNAAQTPNPNQAPTANPQQEQKITANLRVAPPSNKPRFGHYQDTLRRQVTAPRWRTNSDSGSQAQQLQARRPHVRTSSASRANPQRVPEPSQQGPGKSRTVAQQQQGQDMSESLMAFQQAEHLVQQNADDADIVAVIEQQRPHPQMHHHDQKVHPSALSIEEAKILQSLDRLNARLKTVTADMTGSFTPAYPIMPPRPPAHGGGFRGHRPMSSRPGTGGVGRSTLRTRAHSADRYNVRMGQHR